MSVYELHEACSPIYYGLEEFSGVWAAKTCYFGQYCRFLSFFPSILAQIKPKLRPFGACLPPASPINGQRLYFMRSFAPPLRLYSVQ